MNLLPGYSVRQGSTLDKALLVKFMQRTYQEQFPDQNFSHLAHTVEQYFCRNTPLWWVDAEVREQGAGGGEQGAGGNNFPITNHQSPVACLWVGNAIDQVSGDRHPHIFLLYVIPEYRRRGLGKALMNYIENWAKQNRNASGEQTYHQIGLQVFLSNTPALNLYHQLGYQEQSLWMIKSL
ncbi:GNAT family N-acetyltransferase [Dolichospermum compactum]|uniref:GCN5-like N-acetyltransferase n=1 Tax=Dolichospermum compactum NIES-806 TaxID=1973481 RepID=A0A1Z4V5S5_9CYAN|nr:GNAT family N-acetyltransferase [Dolichospermum compactum]BAZ86689.1 GCN5-like N-acetyltransferase [Dolichospermum compactum NIES-806]